MTWIVRPHSAVVTRAVRRGFSFNHRRLWNTGVTRRSLSSGGHSADPVAGDDDRMCGRDLAARNARGLQVTFRPENQRAQGMPDARCTRGLMRKW
jgi:hypothetical protein